MSNTERCRKLATEYSKGLDAYLLKFTPASIQDGATHLCGSCMWISDVWCNFRPSADIGYRAHEAILAGRFGEAARNWLRAFESASPEPGPTIERLLFVANMRHLVNAALDDGDVA